MNDTLSDLAVSPPKLPLAWTTTFSSALAVWNSGLDDKVLGMCSLTQLQLVVDSLEWPKKGWVGAQCGSNFGALFDHVDLSTVLVNKYDLQGLIALRLRRDSVE